MMFYRAITLTWHELHNASNHRKLDCLFNYLIVIKTTKTAKLWITYPFWGKSIGHQMIPLTKGQQCETRFHAMASVWSTRPTTKKHCRDEKSMSIYLLPASSFLIYIIGIHSCITQPDFSWQLSSPFLSTTSSVWLPICLRNQTAKEKHRWGT